MSEFDDFIRGIGSDIKNVAEKVGKKAEETFEISKRQAEKMKIKGHIQSLYQQLGELTYGGMKNGDDVSEETAALIEQLDKAFFRIEEGKKRQHRRRSVPQRYFLLHLQKEGHPDLLPKLDHPGG